MSLLPSNKEWTILLLAFLTIVGSLIVTAQAQETVLTGRILDRNGAVVPNIAVTTKLVGKRVEVRTNEDGVYLIPLKSGIYTITINPQPVRMNGFETLVLTGFRISPAYDGKMNLDFSLPVHGDGVICELMVTPSIKKHRPSRKIKVNENRLTVKTINNEHINIWNN